MKRGTRTLIARSAGACAALPLVAAPAAASEGGLSLLPEWWLLFTMMALFVALIFPVNALLFRPIFRVLDERDERIAGNRRRAEALSTRANEALGRYERAVREVREDAERTRKATLEEARRASAERGAAARSEADGEIARSRAEIAGALGDARTQLRAGADDLARIAAERILGRPLS